MNKLKQLLTMAFLLATILTFGQTNMTKTEEQPYIEVAGTAEKEVIPDEIYIGVIIREKYVNKVKVTIEEQEEKLKSAVKSLGIDLTNLYLSDANADYVKIRWQKKDVLTKKDYTLKVSDATTVGKVFQELEKLEITDAFILKVNHSKIDSLRKEVKILAIKAAKDKADYLLTAIGEQTGKPLIVRENDILPLANVTGVNFRGSRSEETLYYIDGIKMKSEENNEIQFQKIKLISTIYVKFSIK
ncbi:MAG: SIMPL domain-containing protein [Bacteroidia bacterium]